jgi:hypothetical protein
MNCQGRNATPVFGIVHKHAGARRSAAAGAAVMVFINVAPRDILCRGRERGL